MATDRKQVTNNGPQTAIAFPHSPLPHASPAAVQPQPAVIHLKERHPLMLKNDLIARNPLRVLGPEGNPLIAGGFGGVLARAGVGKTAFLVQLALDGLLNGRNVLHISLQDPVQKVTLWYKEVLRNIATFYEVSDMGALWETMLPRRFIMTFRVEGFSAPKLDERLTDLTEQGIFTPQMMLIDGLPFDDPQTRSSLVDLKRLAQDHGLPIWFAVRIHRHETPDDDGLPAQLAGIEDLFEVLLQLMPEGKEIHVRALRGGPEGRGDLPLDLDPATMLLKAKH